MGIYILVSVLILITCVLIVLVVLVQNSKGGGLASTFSSSNQIMGVRKTADFLEKATWYMALFLLVLSLFSFMIIPKAGNKSAVDTELRGKLNNNTQPIKDFQKAPENPQQKK
jgi:preprotein translocase subunit SecG